MASADLAQYVGLRHDLLSREAEHALLTKLAKARTAAAQGTRGAAARLRRLRGVVVRHNLRLIVRVARKFRGRGLDLEDLIGEGVAGLLRALDRFDPGRGVTLSTYGSWWITHYMRRALADLGRTIRVPVHLLEARSGILGASARLQARTGKAPSVEELARLTGKSLKAVAAALSLSTPLSLDAPSFEDDERATLHEAIADCAPDPLEVLLGKERESEARRAIAALPPKEAAVIASRFALSGGEPQTLGEVGDGVLGGLCRERARQVEANGLRRLRQTIEPSVRLR